MRHRSLKVFAPGILATMALVLVVGASAQAPAPAPPAAKAPEAAPQATPQPTPMPGHDMHGTAAAPHDGDMKMDCEAMMAKHQAMQDSMKAQDATLDALVAEMNAAKTSKAPDAMEKPMAAVLNELVAQRKAQRAMMMEMQPGMMGHMGRHMGMKMHGEKGGMDCPMMKMDDAAAPMVMEKKPKT